MSGLANKLVPTVGETQNRQQSVLFKTILRQIMSGDEFLEVSAPFAVPY